VHEVAAAAAEANGAAAQFVGLPSTSRRNGVGSEQNFGDLAVRAAFKPAVEAAEPEGARKGSWPANFAKYFAGRKRVFIPEDNDDTGRASAREKPRPSKRTPGPTRRRRTAG